MATRVAAVSVYLPPALPDGYAPRPMGQFSLRLRCPSLPVVDWSYEFPLILGLQGFPVRAEYPAR